MRTVKWISPTLRERRKFLAVLALCSVTLMLISQLKLKVFGYRYGQAGMSAVLLFYLPFAGRCLETRLLIVALRCLIAVGLVVMALSKATEKPWIANGWIAELALGPADYAGNEWRDGRRMKQVRMLQAAVPPGQPMLAVLNWSPLLDFRRNPIAVMDDPTEIGPPGMPRADDSVGWAHYLIGLGFHYVAYSHADAVAHRHWNEQNIARFSDPSRSSPFMVDLSIAAIQMTETLFALREIGTVVYDDGDEFVIRLDGR